MFVGIIEDHPVTGLHCCGVAGPGLLPAQLHFELLQVDGVAVLAGDQLAEIDRETIGIVEDESILAGNASCSGIAFHNGVYKADALGQCTQESLFFLAYHILYKSLLPDKLRIGLAHDFYQHGDETAQERFAKAQESIAITDCTAQDTADDITGLDIGGQLTVGYREGNGSDMVGHNPHRHVHILRFLPVLMS